MVRERQKSVRRKRHPTPALRKKQRPLETVAEARGQIATVEREFKGGKVKFIAYTNLLSRAYAGSRPNKHAIRLIRQARDGIAIKWLGEKPLRKKGEAKAAAKPFPQSRLSETTHLHIKNLKSQLAKKKFRVCQNLIHVLVADTPKRESRIVANLLEQKAQDVVEVIANESNIKKRKAYVEIGIKLYAAAELLYENVGNHLEAKEMRKSLEHLHKWQFKKF